MPRLRILNVVVLLITTVCAVTFAARLAIAQSSSNEVETVTRDGESIGESDDKKGRVILGVGIRDTATTKVTTIYLDSNATRLEMELGDEIMSLNDQKTASLDDLRTALRGLKVGDLVKLEVKRDGELITLGPIPMK